jgi:hypothetical protein
MEWEKEGHGVDDDSCKWMEGVAANANMIGSLMTTGRQSGAWREVDGKGIHLQ